MFFIMTFFFFFFFFLHTGVALSASVLPGCGWMLIKLWSCIWTSCVLTSCWEMYSYEGYNVGFSPAVNQDRILHVHSFFLIVLEGKKGGGKKNTKQNKPYVMINQIRACARHCICAVCLFLQHLSYWYALGCLDHCLWTCAVKQQ